LFDVIFLLNDHRRRESTAAPTPEFGVVLMVGGNIPGVTRTDSIAIYDHVQALDYAAANRMALVLMAFSFVTLSITYSLNRWVWAVWPPHRSHALIKTYSCNLVEKKNNST
jgi:hypothetical protein